MPEEKTVNVKKQRLVCAGILSVLLIIALLATSIVFIVLYATKGSSNDLPAWPAPSMSPLGKYKKAAVAADNVLCSEIGRDAMLNGGNAVDAAIAALFCIGIMDAHSTGIGGGFFMNVYNASTQKCSVIDSRDMAPYGANKDMFSAQANLSEYGWLSIAIPGQVHGMWTAYNKYGGGVASWQSLVQPTVNLLAEGYPMPTAQANALHNKEGMVTAEPTMKEFINPSTGKVYLAGEQVTSRTSFLELHRQLANATDPVDLFYNQLADTFAQEISKNGNSDQGLITADDFRKYKSNVHEGDEVMYVTLKGGNRIACGPPPPSSASVAQGILNIMDGYDHDTSTYDGNVLFYHRLIESSKFAFAARSGMGDPSFEAAANSTDIAKQLVSSEWAVSVRQKITDKAHPDSYYGAQFEGPSDHGTTSISVIDPWGNAVTVTSTINLNFGSMRASTAYGVVWNDSMDDFSQPGNSNYFGFPASPSNYIEGGKRPMSSMSPLVIIDKDDQGNVTQLLSVGAAGGSTIISGVAGVALHTLWLNSTVKEAVDWPRLHNQLEPNATDVENGFPMEYRKSLEDRGQTFHVSNNGTVVTAAQIGLDQQIYANSDYRKGQESGTAGY